MPLPRLFLADGTPATQANSVITNDPDPLVTIGVDLFQHRDIGRNDARIAAGGSIETVYCRAGKVVRKSELDVILTDDVV